MLIEPLKTQLQTLGLRGMGRALEHQHRNPEVEALPFADRLIWLLQHEVAKRRSHRLAQRQRGSISRNKAVMFSTPRCRPGWRRFAT